MSASDTNGPFNFNNWLNHDGDGGTKTKDEFLIGQNNRIHSPDDGDRNSVTLLGATIVDVRTPQNAALVGKNGCVNDASIGVYGQSLGPSPFGGIGVAGACDAGCGVAGIAIAESSSSTVLDLPPNSTGVYGKGDFHGVYGASGTIPAGSTPDLSVLGPTQQTVAVVGANNDSVGVAAHAPAILGINGILAQDLQRLQFKNDMHDLLVQVPAGVEGVSRNGNGVVGISFDPVPPGADLPTGLALAAQFNEPKPNNPLQDPLRPLGSEDPLRPLGSIKPEPDINSAGVAGLSMTGPGVRGISETDRGGLFQSGTRLNVTSLTTAPVAQIRLVPFRQEAVSPGETPLPRKALVGDLLALATPNPQTDGRGAFTFDLWLCVASGDPGSPAHWKKIQLESTVFVGTR
jgi:hypothetical protein